MLGEAGPDCLLLDVFAVEAEFFDWGTVLTDGTSVSVSLKLVFVFLVNVVSVRPVSST